MEKGLSLALVLIAVALLFWRPLRRVRAALSISHLIATGHVFLALGYALGWVAGGASKEVSDQLAPVVAFVAGWIGFSTGIRFDFRILRTLPTRAYALGLFPSLFTAAVIGTGGLFLLERAGLEAAQACAGAIVLSAAAASSGPTLVALLRSRRAGRASAARPVLRMIEFSAGIADLLVVGLAIFAFAAFRPTSEPISALGLVATSMGGGVLLGVVTWLLLGGKAKQDERMLLGLGMLVSIAGFAAWLHFSPAAIAAASAIVLVNLPGKRNTQLLDAVRRVERPAMVVLMAVIGYHLTGNVSWMFFPLVLALTLARLLAHRFAGLFVSQSGVTPGLGTFPRWTDGLTPQGILGVMVALSFFHVWRDEAARTILAAIAVSSVLNEILAPWLFLGLMRDLVAAPRQKEETRK